MKTSNIILSLITIFFFGSIVGTAMILKQEYEKIDFEDPFYGLVRNELPAFSVVKLQGNYHGLVEIRPGEKHKLLHPYNLRSLRWEVRADTLFVNYTGESRGGRNFSEQTFKNNHPAAYVVAPAVSSVVSEGMSLRVNGLTADHFKARFNGKSGGISFKGNTIKKLSAQAGASGILQLENDNRIDMASISAEDKSKLIITLQQIDSLEIKASSQANVQLPGALLEKIKR